MASAGPMRYWHTLRHLRPVQIYGRLCFRLWRPSPDMSPAPPLRKAGEWIVPACVRPSMTSPSAFRFLNEEHSLDETGWNPSNIEKLWVYNLHYFADLGAQGAESRARWHRALMERWVRENPPGQGNGWEPYPTSLRIVNWIKWALAGNEMSTECVESLAVQARWLRKRMEWHILGNHLFVNAKALVFAGLFFEGPEADAWLNLGAQVLGAQIPEQILPDGGQFERSPMYHALALEDMLDLCNVLRAYPGACAWSPNDANAELELMVASRVQKMRCWLHAMCHPDGEISFFNDSAIGIAPSPAELDAYAMRLGFEPLVACADGVTHLAESGYIRVQRGEMVALLDVAPVGPDYLPGHAHADTLSFELSLHGHRVLMNSGTSVYGSGPERQRQRGTVAHNTVVVRGRDSSEVWGGFRVARRARPFGLQIQAQNEVIGIECSHDGYKRLGAVHRRRWNFAGSSLKVMDETGASSQSVWHFAPEMAVKPEGARAFVASDPHGKAVRIGVEHASATQVASTVHKEFGSSVAAAVLICEFDKLSTVAIDWN